MVCYIFDTDNQLWCFGVHYAIIDSSFIQNCFLYWISDRNCWLLYTNGWSGPKAIRNISSDFLAWDSAEKLTKINQNCKKKILETMIHRPTFFATFDAGGGGGGTVCTLNWAFSDCIRRGNLVLMYCKPLTQRVQNWIVDRSTARDFTVQFNAI